MDKHPAPPGGTPPVVITDEQHPEGFTPPARQPAPPAKEGKKAVSRREARNARINRTIFTPDNPPPPHLRRPEFDPVLPHKISMADSSAGIKAMVGRAARRKKEELRKQLDAPTVNELAMKRIGEMNAKRTGAQAPEKEKEIERATERAPHDAEAPAGQPGEAPAAELQVEAARTAPDDGGAVRPARPRKKRRRTPAAG